MCCSPSPQFSVVLLKHNSYYTYLSFSFQVNTHFLTLFSGSRVPDLGFKKIFQIGLIWRHRDLYWLYSKIKLLITNEMGKTVRPGDPSIR